MFGAWHGLVLLLEIGQSIDRDGRRTDSKNQERLILPSSGGGQGFCCNGTLHQRGSFRVPPLPRSENRTTPDQCPQPSNTRPMPVSSGKGLVRRAGDAVEASAMMGHSDGGKTLTETLETYTATARGERPDDFGKTVFPATDFATDKPLCEYSTVKNYGRFVPRRKVSDQRSCLLRPGLARGFAVFCFRSLFLRLLSRFA